jgi:hypothetical protein
MRLLIDGTRPPPLRSRPIAPDGPSPRARGSIFRYLLRALKKAMTPAHVPLLLFPRLFQSLPLFSSVHLLPLPASNFFSTYPIPLLIFDAVRREPVCWRRRLLRPAGIRISCQWSVLSAAAAAPADSASILGPAATILCNPLRRDRSVSPTIALRRSFRPPARSVSTVGSSPAAYAYSAPDDYEHSKAHRLCFYKEATTVCP